MVGDKLHLSDEIGQTNDDYSLVVELPDSDPLFERKKKLLQIKGFDPKARVYFERSSCPNWVYATLEKILQRARIIHLNEVTAFLLPKLHGLHSKDVSQRFKGSSGSLYKRCGPWFARKMYIAL
ncbi:hypothetical protein L1049_022756 [Liquidambar formosana]|uniref:Uncharacterized protein n=1 Tax=Liquidambar formosana TaxID=63359 RepID=A0AAP0RDG9_LIQFO